MAGRGTEIDPGKVRRRIGLVDCGDLREIQRNIDLLKAAMASTSCGITIADATLPDLPLIYVNRAFEELTGYPAEEVLGKNCRFLQGDERDPEALARIHEALENGTDTTVLLKNFRKNGTLFWNELRLSPIHTGSEGDSPDYFVGIQTDVTEKVESKSRLRASNRALEESNEKLEAAHREKDRLMATVAHDLRGPIGNIRSLVEVALESDAEASREFLQTALEAADGALALVGDLVDLSAVRSGQLEIRRKETDLEEFLDRFAETARIRAGRKDIDFSERRDLREPAGFFDPLRIQQVLDNLFTNALKFSERNSPVVLEARSDADGVVFRMIDQGRGIPAENQGKIFEPFSRNRVAPTEGEPSSGLGLSIVRRIVELHDGELALESEPGRGSTFTVRLPVLRD